MNVWLELIWEAVADCLRMLPCLFLAYLLIEYIEQYQSARLQRLLAGNGRWGFAVGSALGLVPQCGFSAMSANLYAARVITPGTLLAVFLSTSDEALPLLAATGDMATLGWLMAMKLVWAMACGFALDRLGRFARPGRGWGGYSGRQEDCDCHDHRENERVLPAALRHTAQVFLLVLALTLALSLLMAFAGESWLAAALVAVGPWQTPLAALVGLVPNCAVSVLLMRLYTEGLLGFGALFAGLASGAGMGLIVLWRTNPSRRENLRLTVTLYLCAVAGGWLAGLLH